MKNILWKTLFITGIAALTSMVYAEEKFKCGTYEFTGVIKKFEGKNVLKLYEGSMSEIILSLSPDLNEVAEAYIDNAVVLKGKMYEPIETYRGKIESSKTPEEIKKLTAPGVPYTARFMRDDIKERIPDPLHPDLDSGMKLIKEENCKKKPKKN